MKLCGIFKGVPENKWAPKKGGVRGNCFTRLTQYLPLLILKIFCFSSLSAVKIHSQFINPGCSFLCLLTLFSTSNSGIFLNLLRLFKVFPGILWFFAKFDTLHFLRTKFHIFLSAIS